MSSEWTSEELEYLLSLPESELEAWLRELPEREREGLTQQLLAHIEQTPEPEPAEATEWVPSKAKLAPLLGMSVVMLDRYIGYGARLAGPPYDLAAATAEIERVRKERAGNQDQIGPDLRRERMMAELEEKRQSGRAKQLKNDILEGKSYPADEVDQYLAEYASRIKTRLEQFPAEAIAGIPQQWRDTVRTALETAVFELLLEMAGTSYRAQGGYDDDHVNL